MVFAYVFSGIAAALFIAGACLVAFKAGEKDLICKYEMEESKNDTLR